MEVRIRPGHYDEMRDWLADCFEDCPADLSDWEAAEAVRHHYDGGIKGFLADAVTL